MTSYLYTADMAKEKLTVYLDPEVAQAMGVSAARRKMKDSELVEEALREWLGISALERLESEATLDWEEGLELAVRVQHESRERRQAAS